MESQPCPPSTQRLSEELPEAQRDEAVDPVSPWIPGVAMASSVPVAGTVQKLFKGQEGVRQTGECEWVMDDCALRDALMLSKNQSPSTYWAGHAV